MAGQAILGETVLKSAMAMEATALTVEALVADHSRMVFRIAYSILRNHHVPPASPKKEKHEQFRWFRASTLY
jgi:hypothetical protein